MCEPEIGIMIISYRPLVPLSYVSTLASTDILGDVISISISGSGIERMMNCCCRSIVWSSGDSTEGRNNDPSPICICEQGAGTDGCRMMTGLGATSGFHDWAISSAVSAERLEL